MSAAGNRKKMERLVKQAKRDLLVPYEARTPHDKKKFDRFASALKLALRGKHIPS